jgi:small GTP-binding protein
VPFESKYTFKVVFIGDAAVGKTSLIARHISASFKGNYVPTLGANVTSKDYNVKGQTITLMIWDIAAQEGYNEVRADYYSGAKAAFAVYDVTRPETYDDILFWLDDLKKAVPKKIPIVLVANKIDLPAVVNSKTAEKLAHDLRLDYIQTSAKSGENVEESFQGIVEKLIKAVPAKTISKKESK